MSRSPGLVAVAAALSLGPLAASGQCADGSAQGSCAPRVAATRAIDANRIAILPFRTTGADPALGYLSSGMVELLSAEFNGETGPEAVEPGETLRAWQQVGGGRLVTAAMAIRVARALGAGQVAIGSVVGTSSGFTLSATIHDVSDGKVRVGQVQVRGVQDSLNTATTSLAAQLRGKGAGILHNTSNEALLAYLEAMASYRKPPVTAAQMEPPLLKATQLDSSFIPAAYQLTLFRAWHGPQAGNRDFRPAFRVLWRRRHELNPQQRLLLEAVADSVNLHLRMAALPRLERSIGALQNSAEAWTLLTEYYFFVGGALGREDWRDRTKQAGLRALELNESLCACTRETLADLAWLVRDARMLVKYGGDLPGTRYRLAILNGNTAAIRSARLDYANWLSGANLANGFLPNWLTGIPLPMAEVDSLLAALEPLANSEQQRRSLAGFSSMAWHHAGRPKAAREALRRMFGSDTSQQFINGLFAYDDTSGISEALEHQARNCDLGLMILRHGATGLPPDWLHSLTPANDNLEWILADIMRGQTEKVCNQVLRGVAASFDPAARPLLYRADSLMRVMPLNWDWGNYDLSLAFARIGDYRMAAAASRRYVRGVSTWRQPYIVLSLRNEGKWAALAGDTASAIRALREYLVYRTNPEPVLRPQLDSVRAELAVLQQATQRAAPRRP